MAVKNAIILGVGLADHVSKDLEKIGNTLRAKGRNLSSIGGELTQGLTFPIVAAGAAMLKFAGDLDALKRALAVTMGSASAAEVEFKKLKIAAEVPGMGLEEAIKGSFLLQGLGASADGARHMLLGLAKAVERSGGGADQFAGLTQQFTQMLNVGRLLQEDIKFMKVNAPALGGIMQDLFGTSNPEQLRELVGVKEFVKKLIDELNKLPGTGGSVKNTLENIWTSLRVGAGEIGLAILGATNLGQGLDMLNNKINSVSSGVVKWVKENRGLTITLIKMFGVMAATGPIIRFIGNLGMVAGMAAKATTFLYGMAKSLLAVNNAMTAGAIAGKSFGWGLILAGSAYASFKLNKSLIEGVDQRKSDMGILETDDFDERERKRKAYWAKHPTGAPKSSMHGQFPSLIPGSSQSSAPHYLAAPKTPESTLEKDWADFIKNNPGAGGKGKKDEEFEKWVKLKREMAEMFSESPVKSRYEISGLRSNGIGDIKANSPFEGLDTKVLTEYQNALRGITMEQNLGAKAVDVLKMKMDAAAEAYKAMAESYGLNSPEATGMLDQWKRASEEYTTFADLQLEKQEKINKTMEYMQMAIGGVTDGLIGMFTDSENGFKNFGKQLLQVVANMVKLLITTAITQALMALLTGGASAIGGPIGGLLNGAKKGIGGSGFIPGLQGLADGGLLTGEQIVRAGEYQGVKHDPELISPVSKVQKYIREAVGNSGGGGGYGIIRGRDIHFVTKLAQQDSARKGGTTIRF